MQLVPERDLCFAILTNHSDGWMLNEDVATALLSRLEGLALSKGQRTGGNRGGNERMTEHSQPLATQPPLEEYTGRFVRKGVLAGFATAATVGSFDIAIDEGSCQDGSGQLAVAAGANGETAHSSSPRAPLWLWS